MKFFRDYKNAFKVTFIFVLATAFLVFALYEFGFYEGAGTEEFIQAMYFTVPEFLVFLIVFNIWYRLSDKATADEIYTNEMVRKAHNLGVGSLVASLIATGIIIGAAIAASVAGLVFGDLDNMMFAVVAVSAEAVLGNVFLIIFLFPAVAFAGPGRISGQY